MNREVKRRTVDLEESFEEMKHYLEKEVWYYCASSEARATESGATV